MWRGRARHAVNLAGGMHHATAVRAADFCVYNDVVAAIRALLATRKAVSDWYGLDAVFA